MNAFRFCPTCATPLELLALMEDGGPKERLRCVGCGWTHWNNPTPVLAAIGLSADRLRARWPTLPTLARRAAPVVLTAMAILLAVRAIGHSTPHDAAKTAAHGHSNGAR